MYIYYIIIKYVKCVYILKEILFCPIPFLVPAWAPSRRIGQGNGMTTQDVWTPSWQVTSTTLTPTMTASSQTSTHPMITSLWCTTGLSHLTRMIVSLPSPPRSLSLTPSLGSVWISVPLIWRGWTECTTAVSTSESKDWIPPLTLQVSHAFSFVLIC